MAVCVIEARCPPYADWKVTTITTATPASCSRRAVRSRARAAALGEMTIRTVPGPVTVLAPRPKTSHSGRQCPATFAWNAGRRREVVAMTRESGLR